jgi:hypothetical protein
MERSKHTQRFSLSGKMALIPKFYRDLSREIAKFMAEARVLVILNDREREVLGNNVRMLPVFYLRKRKPQLGHGPSTQGRYLGKGEDSAFVANTVGLERLTQALATELGPQRNHTDSLLNGGNCGNGHLP